MDRETNSQRDDAWSACPPGTLRRMIGDVRQARRHAVASRVTSVLAVVCLLGAGSWLGVQALIQSDVGAGPQQFVNLRCSEIRDLLAQYGHGALANSLQEQISAHLRECPSCREHHLQLQKDEQLKKQTSWLAKRVPAKI